ncbi:hypothetical protein [Flavobacterium sp. FlaQc-48]|uniref:hypothetical protein n=1 Tax=Flavobacterium sp. FlaQc-48 TaxID=3374181 RepID=UPI0037568E91
MESESKQVTGTKKETIDIQSGTGRGVDLGTNTPSLEIKIMNEGPSNNVIVSGSHYELRTGQQGTFRLGDLTSGSVITLQNNGFEHARVQISW